MNAAAIARPFACLVTVLSTSAALAQAYGEPDRGEPGDEMIQEYLAREAEEIHARFLEGVRTAEEWQALRGRYREEYLYMLGLWPLPERTPLEATVTGKLEGDGFVVEMLHYQSRPGLYVTANLYRPGRPSRSAESDDARRPAVLYVCGHSPRGRNGNKTAYQSHGIWFARHGYVCLVVDTLQMGEIAAIHHGTYREERWWWHSRGYTPAGVECWNGVRGIDYLTSRNDVDPERIAVTGISGGGAATFWVAAADDRARVAVPVSGMADLPSYVGNRVINGHCDCMFLHNTFEWPWTRIAALLAPRPLLFVNSDRDAIFPMDANERVIERLERLYSLFGAGDMVDGVVSIGGHAYREDIRRAAYRFINTHLMGDPRPVSDSEIDLVTGPRSERRHPIAPERLRVFPTDADIPEDELNTTIDRHFVAPASPEPPREGEFEGWQEDILAELRRVTFRHLPERVPPGRPADDASGSERPGTLLLSSEEGIRFALRPAKELPERPESIVIAVSTGDESAAREAADRFAGERDAAWIVEPRGVGPTRWTRRNPPNFVERAHVLLGRTVDTGRVLDVIAAARYLRASSNGAPVRLVGSGSAGLIALYAALWEPEIASVGVIRPPATHRDAGAPQFLNILRVLDAPAAFGLLAPRPLEIVDGVADAFEATEEIYRAAGAKEALRLR